MAPINVESAHSPQRDTPDTKSLPSSETSSQQTPTGDQRKHPVADTVESVKKSSRSEDRPMGEDQPQAPFALVGLSYYIALAIAGLILGGIYFLYF